MIVKFKAPSIVKHPTPIIIIFLATDEFKKVGYTKSNTADGVVLAEVDEDYYDNIKNMLEVIPIAIITSKEKL